MPFYHCGIATTRRWRVSRFLSVILGLACAGLRAEDALDGMSAQEMVAHLATVAKDLKRQPAIVLNSAKPADVYLTAVAKNTNGEMTAVGVHGAILKSSDGKHWIQSQMGTDVTFTTVKFLESGEGWLGGHEGTIMNLHPKNGEWKLSRTDPAFDGPILDFLFFEENVGLALSSGGVVFRTVDRGKVWDVTEILTEDFFNPHFFSAARLGANGAIIVGERGAVFRTQDRGLTWIELPRPFIGSLFGVARLVGGTLLTYGITGHAFYSKDSGNRWSMLETGVEDSLFTHAQEGRDIVLLFGADGVVLRVTQQHSAKPVVTNLPKVGRFTVSSAVRQDDGQIIGATNRGIQNFIAEKGLLVDRPNPIN